MNIAAHIQKEIKEFVKTTEVPIIGGSVEMCTQQFIGSDKFISNVTGDRTLTRNKQVIFVVENNQDRPSLEDTTAGRKYAGTLIPAGNTLNLGDGTLYINEEGVVFVTV